MCSEDSNKCYWCSALNEEEKEIMVSELHIDGGYYNFRIPIFYCPACGTKLKKYSMRNDKGTAES